MRRASSFPHHEPRRRAACRQNDPFHPIGGGRGWGANADGSTATSISRTIAARRTRIASSPSRLKTRSCADLEAIAKLRRHRYLFFGPADFSHGLGAPGDFTNPKLLETRRRVAEVCRRPAYSPEPSLAWTPGRACRDGLSVPQRRGGCVGPQQLHSGTDRRFPKEDFRGGSVEALV